LGNDLEEKINAIIEDIHELKELKELNKTVITTNKSARG
jgi:hypothetical protein